MRPVRRGRSHRVRRFRQVSASARAAKACGSASAAGGEGERPRRGGEQKLARGDALLRSSEHEALRGPDEEPRSNDPSDVSRRLRRRQPALRRIQAGERSEEHTSELQSLAYLVCRLLLEKKKLMEHMVLEY